jgi:hypothetical protein
MGDSEIGVELTEQDYTVSVDDLLKQIAVALPLWNSFVESEGPKFNSEEIFQRRTEINPVALRFLRHCAQIILGSPRSAHIIFSKLSPAPSNSAMLWSGRAASWLFHMGNNVPVIYVDKDIISSGTVAPMLEKNKIITRVVLHEIGHIVHHWKTLRPMGCRHANPATPQQEEEAWWFCGLIIGLALGLASKQARLREPPAHDPVWCHT